MISQIPRENGTQKENRWGVTSHVFFFISGGVTFNDPAQKKPSPEINAEQRITKQVLQEQTQAYRI